LKTFFGLQTAPQFSCKRFLDAEGDYAKFVAAFESHMEYRDAIKDEVKEWVSNNIERLRVDNLDCFKIELIPDEFLPENVFESLGGRNRRRESQRVSLQHAVRTSVNFSDDSESSKGKRTGRNLNEMSLHLRAEFGVENDDWDTCRVRNNSNSARVVPEEV